MLAIILPILIFPLYFIHPQPSSLFNISQSIPTISLAGGSAPESIIFTFIMHLISLLIVPLYISIYITYKEKLTNISITNDNEKYVNVMKRMNCVSLIFGILATVSMYLTGSVSVNYDFTAHFSFAVCIFIPASIHIIMYRIMITIMTKKLMISIPSRTITLIIIAFHITVTFNIIVLIIDIIIYFSCFSDICRSYVVDILPVLEFTTVIAFLIYFESFRPVYNDASITLKIRTTNNDNMSVNDDDTSALAITHTVI